MCCAREIAFKSHNSEVGSTFLEFSKLCLDHFYFTVSTGLQIDRTFYDLISCDQPSKPSFMVNLLPGYIGRTSMNFVYHLTTDDHPNFLAKHTTQYVIVDKDSRKPVLIPDWWRRKYEKYFDSKQNLVFAPLELPKANTTAFRYNMKPTWSDTDQYSHVNYRAYPRFCFDAAMEAVKMRLFKGFDGDILNYRVKTIESTYKGECVAGDQITVVSWQNSEYPLILYFIIEKDGKFIYQSTVEFYK